MFTGLQLSPGLVNLDWGLEIEGFKVTLVGQSLQSHVQRPAGCVNAQASIFIISWKLAMAQGPCLKRCVLQPGEVIYSGDKLHVGEVPYPQDWEN